MRSKVIVSCLCATLAMSGCATLTNTVGSLGFGGKRLVQPDARENLPDLVPRGGADIISDVRPLAASIVSSELTPTTTGALLRVVVRPGGYGAYNADLVPSSAAAGSVTFDAKLQLSDPAAAPSPAQVTIARPFTFNELAGLRQIRIKAADGVTTISR